MKLLAWPQTMIITALPCLHSHARTPTPPLPLMFAYICAARPTPRARPPAVRHAPHTTHTATSPGSGRGVGRGGPTRANGRPRNLRFCYDRMFRTHRSPLCGHAKRNHGYRPHKLGRTENTVDAACASRAANGAHTHTHTHTHTHCSISSSPAALPPSLPRVPQGSCSPGTNSRSCRAKRRRRRRATRE